MKSHIILKLGKPINKKEQQQIFEGNVTFSSGPCALLEGQFF